MVGYGEAVKRRHEEKVQGQHPKERSEERRPPSPAQGAGKDGQQVQEGKRRYIEIPYDYLAYQRGESDTDGCADIGCGRDGARERRTGRDRLTD